MLRMCYLTQSLEFFWGERQKQRTVFGSKRWNDLKLCTFPEVEVISCLLERLLIPQEGL